ncbi:MAG: SDR family NAD(P)-dependent oxidoreductase [Lachnospiraceae bacterium]|nr:SDR family NAD(P)-dependent oxidoreductase [Lachnospiraceae bacterium]
MNLFDLTGKKAIVTGGCQGLGKSMAEGLTEAGAKVCLMDLNPETKQIAEEMSTESRTFCGVVVNLLDREDLTRGFQEAVDELGGLDILINNAGMQVRGNAEEIELSRWDKLIELNLTAVFEMSQLAARHMLQSGGGKIINVASMLSFFGGYVCSPYAASKGAVAQLTKAFSNEWAGKGINVNAIAPGYMETPLNTAIINDPVRNQEITARIPAHRWGVPDDLKGTIIFLASSASDYVSGAIIPVDGGYLGR